MKVTGLGLTLGDIDGLIEGDAEGLMLGLAEGDMENDALGLRLELRDGDIDGLKDGDADGENEGLPMRYVGILQPCCLKNQQRWIGFQCSSH